MKRVTRKWRDALSRLVGAAPVFAAGLLLAAAASAPAKEVPQTHDSALQCKVFAHLATVSGSVWDERVLARLIARNGTTPSDAPSDHAEPIAHPAEVEHRN